jgi:hypothetical protein
MTRNKKQKECRQHFSLEVHEIFEEVEKQDSKIYQELLRKIIRIKTIIKTGNVRAWERMKMREADNIDKLIKEFDEQNQLDGTRGKIASI